MNETVTTKVTQFTTTKGNTVQVFTERGTSRRNGFVGRTESVRTWGEVNGVEVDVTPGCVFEVSSKVEQSGF